MIGHRSIACLAQGSGAGFDIGTMHLRHFGGWCAWAMLDGDKTKVDPETYKIVDGRLFVYYNGFFGNTLKSWNEKASKEGDMALAAKADKQWSRIVKKS